MLSKIKQFLLLSILTLGILQLTPLFGVNSSLSAQRAIQDVVRVTWIDGATIRLTVTDSDANFNEGVNIQDSVQGDYKFAAEYNKENDKLVYYSFVEGQPNACDGRGNSGGTVNDKTSRFLVTEAGAEKGDMILRYKSGNDCKQMNIFGMEIGKDANFVMPPDPSNPLGEQGDNDANCENRDGGFSSAWLMCPLIYLTDGALGWVDSSIERLLEVDRNRFDRPDVRDAWSNIRNIAYLILVPIALVMVISTALGFEFVSAYTVKRALPRLGAAVIFIALSYEITTLLIDIANGIGFSTKGLLQAPFNTGGDINLTTLFGGSPLTSILALPFAGIGVILIIWLFGGTLLLFAGSAFLVLMLRQILIIALMLIAPLAILAWIFPGNDKLWKTWWGTFSKLLMMFPLIMAVISVGHIFAWIIDQNGSGLDGMVLQPLMTLAAYMLPYAAIPFTFKFAGGMFATISGIANDRSKGLFDRQRKSRATKYDRLKSGNVFRGAPENSLRSSLNRGIGYTANIKKAGLRPSQMRGNLKSYMGDIELEQALKASEELTGAKSFFANDDLMMAGLEGRGDLAATRNFLMKPENGGYSGEQLEIALGQIMSMRKQMGGEGFALAALAKLPATGTAYEEDDIGKWYEDIAKYTNGNKSLQGSIVAAGKSGFRSAQRYEVSEAGFGDHMKAISMAEKGAKTQDITDMIVDKAYMGGGPAAVVGSRNAKTAGMFAKTINSKLDEAKSQLATAVTSGADEKTIESLEREVIQQQAAIDSIHDQAGQAKQVVGKVLADEVFGREGRTTARVVTPDGTTHEREVRSGKTQLQEIDAIRSRRELHEMKKEYSLTEEEARRRAEAGGVPGDGITPPTPGGGLGPGL